jgi:hypothetical protein
MSNIFRIYFKLNPPRDQVIRHDDARHVEELAPFDEFWDLPEEELAPFDVPTPRRWGKTIGSPRIDKSKWLIVHPTANLQRERNTFRAAQLWKVIPVSDLLTLIGTFYSAGITFERPVDE